MVAKAARTTWGIAAERPLLSVGVVAKLACLAGSLCLYFSALILAETHEMIVE